MSNELTPIEIIRLESLRLALPPCGATSAPNAERTIEDAKKYERFILGHYTTDPAAKTKFRSTPNTMSKVYEGLREGWAPADLEDSLLTDLVMGMQNQGILFSEVVIDNG